MKLVPQARWLITKHSCHYSRGSIAKRDVHSWRNELYYAVFTSGSAESRSASIFRGCHQVTAGARRTFSPCSIYYIRLVHPGHLHIHMLHARFRPDGKRDADCDHARERSAFFIIIVEYERIKMRRERVVISIIVPRAVDSF